MNCNENYYELIGEIFAYPNTGIHFSHPFNLMKKQISPTEYTLTESARITVPMKSKSATLKETPSLSINGESYEVVVSWQIENVTPDTYLILNSLKEGNKHLIVNTFGDNPLLVRSTEYAYQFEYKESDGNLICELTIQNICGAQRVL